VLRRSGDLGQDAPLRGLAIANPVTAAMPRHHRSQAVAVEPRHPARDGINSGAPNRSAAIV
jgi:hypothetical protein